MTLKFMGKKRGMTQLFDEQGNAIVCTVIEVEPNIVAQIKTKESDGYNAIQLGFEKIKGKDPRTVNARTKKPLRGHFQKGSIEPRRYLKESRVDKVDEFTLGQEIGIGKLAGVEFVDATAMSKGKGYQGVIKRHHFAGGPASHGSGFHRHAGSTGQRTTPGRVFPGGKKAGHMGYEQVTVQNIKVVQINEEDNLILLKGQVPGPRNGLVYIAAAKKKAPKAVKKSHK